METFFTGLDDYEGYLKKHPFYKELGIEDVNFSELSVKNDSHKSANYSPGDITETAYPAELDDLIRLHYLITSRKVSTVLEFGIGKSTITIDHALQHNKREHSEFYANNLRGSNLFECHTVDDDKHWFEKAKSENQTKTVNYHYSQCQVSTFNDRICTYYENLPNIAPDLVYLDGPDQFSPVGDVRGISTAHKDRLPLTADILAMEHFFIPGTLIVLDGRTANARFLRVNLQRSWSYWYFEEADQHYFELTETPLGRFNKAKIDFCIGESFYDRIPKDA